MPEMPSTNPLDLSAAGDDHVFSKPAEFEAAIVEAVRSRLHKRLSQAPTVAFGVAAVAVVADKMVDAMPDLGEVALDEAIGPFYDTAGLANWLGISPQVVQEWIGTRLFAVETQDGDRLFPSFQFESDGALVPHMIEIVQLLEAGLSSPWGVALWLNTPVDDLGNRSIVDCLKQGESSVAFEYATREVDRLTS